VSEPNRETPGLTPPADDYEAEYMTGEGQVLHRSKVVARKLALLLLSLGVLLGVLAAASFTFAPVVASVAMLAGAFFMTFCGLGLSVLRTKVTSEELHVQYGLWGPRVPIAAITACNVIPYDWKRFGGWGLKRSFDGAWSYTPTLVDRVVSVGWSDDKGKTRNAVFAAEDPDAVVAAVRRARALTTGAAAAKARISAQGPVQDEIVDAEFEAPEAAAPAKATTRDP
jgi:hypothetical protein